jgi:hypothetical protein
LDKRWNKSRLSRADPLGKRWNKSRLSRADPWVKDGIRAAAAPNPLDKKRNKSGNS